MLHLILGKDWTENRRAIFLQLARDVAEERENRILLVPELISHDSERLLSRAAGDTSSRFAQVLSFTRLSGRVAEELGTAMAPCLDGGGRLVAMAAAARSLSSRLKAYASVETRPEFLSQLVEAVDEFKRCCIGPRDILLASQKTQGALSQKLEELSLLFETYDALCSRGKRDPRDQETVLLELLEDSDFARNHVFYIDGFPDFSRQHLAILEHLIAHSPSVTVSLNCDVPDSKLLAFEKAGITAGLLLRSARALGIETEISHTGTRNPVTLQIAEALFQGKLPQDPAAAQRLRVFTGDSVYQQCAWAANQIQDLVRSGSRYRDICVVCPDMAGYAPMAQMVFHSCGIPLYRSGTEDILQKTVISSVLYALDAALGGFEQREVLRFLRSALSTLTPEEFDRVENYAILWGIRGSKWLSPWESHPNGLQGVWSEDIRQKLDELEQLRRRSMAPLDAFSRAFAQANSMAGQVLGVYQFFEQIQLAQHLEDMAARRDALGDNRSAQVLNQLWEILIGALEQMYDVLGDTHWDTPAFTRLFTLLLSQYDVGTIPPVLDAVMLGPVKAMRCQAPRHLIVLGANEGSFPAFGSASGVLTDQERLALQRLGVPLTVGATDSIQTEFSEIFSVFCGAGESITVYGSADQASFVYRRLAEMSGGERKGEAVPPTAFAGDFGAGAYLASLADANTARELGVSEEYHRVRRASDHSLGTVTRENVEKLYGSRLRLSASKVDTQAKCRLAYFLQYGLRAKERKEATIDPAEFGTYVHAVLEHTARQVMELGGFHTVSQEKTLEIADHYSREYARQQFSQLDSQRMQYLFKRNTQEVALVVQELWLELSQSRFQPVAFEANFGTHGQMPPIPVPGTDTDASLEGFVDRVDAWQELGRNYFRVVDYKTGSKDFDYCDVFNGIGLQMLLYLFALTDGGEGLLGVNPVPAGVQYFAARVPAVSADGRLSPEEAQLLHGKHFIRQGLLLDDHGVLSAMEPEGAPHRICARRDKNGDFVGDLANREQMKQLREFVFKTLGNIVDDITSGNVTPNPYQRGTAFDSCSYCPYGAVCHKDQLESKRNYKAMKSTEFWDRVGKELGNG